MDPEPGPFWQREPMPLPPRVVGETTFQSLAGALVDMLGDADPSLGAAADTVGRDVPADLDATFGATIGVAEDVTGSQFNLGTDQTADVLTQDGEGAEWYRQSVLQFLPQPDAPIEMELKDPPALPRGPADTGGGDRESEPEA
jgi:hypothetical protein